MAQLWRELKGHISAHDQYPTIAAHAAAAEQWILSLTPPEASRVTVALSENGKIKDAVERRMGSRA